MLDPKHIGLNAESVGFQVSHKQPLDWNSFSVALQNQSDSVKTRRELKETPISELHIMGGQLFGYEGNALTDTRARQMRQMNGYRLRSFDARDTAVVLPPKDAGSLVQMIPVKAGMVQFNRWNAVMPQSLVLRSTEPLNIPLTQDMQMQNMLNMNNTREQIQENINLHNKKRSRVAQNEAAEMASAREENARYGTPAQVIRARERHAEAIRQGRADRAARIGTGIVGVAPAVIPIGGGPESVSGYSESIGSRQSADEAAQSSDNYSGASQLINGSSVNDTLSSRGSLGSIRRRSNDGNVTADTAAISQLSIPSVSGRSSSRVDDTLLNSLATLPRIGSRVHVFATNGSDLSEEMPIIRHAQRSDGEMIPITTGGEPLIYSSGRYYHRNLQARGEFHTRLERSARTASELSMSLVPDSAAFPFSGSGIQNYSADGAILGLSRSVLQKSQSLDIGRSQIRPPDETSLRVQALLKSTRELLDRTSTVQSNSYLNAYKSGANSLQSSAGGAGRSTSVRGANVRSVVDGNGDTTQLSYIRSGRLDMSEL